MFFVRDQNKYDVKLLESNIEYKTSNIILMKYKYIDPHVDDVAFVTDFDLIITGVSKRVIVV
jgi:hypothetical protein